MHLVIVHHHFRPGGVRRVIELATPALVRTLTPAVRCVVLVGGEAPGADWYREFRRRLGSIPVRMVIARAAAYAADTNLRPAERRRRLRRMLARLGPPTATGGLVWLHNPGLGRNLLLNAELVRFCAARTWPLVCHHHDWWFDHRWQRWSEMRRAGGGTLRQTAGRILPAHPLVRHAAINQADARRLRRHFGRRAAWLPNPGESFPRPPASRIASTRRWLREQLGEPAPIWLVPARLLRRKNLAEALLLTRWLRPEAWLVTTGGVSSAAEAAYARGLAGAAEAAGWRLRLGVLAGDERGRPSVPDLLAAAEVVLLTSLQEGFGLPYLEAAAAGRPLIARRLPEVAPDLARLGFRFPHLYREIRIAPDLFDRDAEIVRERALFASWRRSLPQACRPLAGPPVLLADGGAAEAVPFSRLTLDAQLEVLRQPPEHSWSRCQALNPFLAAWREAAAGGRLPAPAWPAAAAARLDGGAYARRFAALLRAAPPVRAARTASARAQRELLAAKLPTGNAYPLLWGT